jgi:hypothetical protein
MAVIKSANTPPVTIFPNFIALPLTILYEAQPVALRAMQNVAEFRILTIRSAKIKSPGMSGFTAPTSAEL